MSRALARLQPLASNSRLTCCISHGSTISSLARIDGDGKRNQGGQKNFAQRVLEMYETLSERRKPPELRRGTGVLSNDPVRVEMQIVNVAERRILQSVMKGEFDKLSGKGKPLKLESNPHADPAEDLAYRILAKNGFAPEWVELNKEIRFKIRRWRLALKLAWFRKMQANSGEETEPDDMKWDSLLPGFETELQEINKKVKDYNLVAPFGRQLMCYKLERELNMLREADDVTAVTIP